MSELFELERRIQDKITASERFFENAVGNIAGKIRDDAKNRIDVIETRLGVIEEMIFNLKQTIELVRQRK